MITLASDFGDPYPAAMKGVILSRCDARLVDVSHEFPRQDVRTAAFWLREVLPYFPPAVHLVVVDPGVGTDRAALVVRAGAHALVGPDNGVLLPAARRLAAESRDGVEVFEWAYDSTDSGSNRDSDTFHGRDVFAPAAARVHEAIGDHSDEERWTAADLDALSTLDRTTPSDDFVDLRFPEPRVEADGAAGEVLVVDGFGNAITNVPGSVLAEREGDTVTVAVGDGSANDGGSSGGDTVSDGGDSVPVARSYAHVSEGQRLVTVGSHGNVELAVNRGRGDDAFGVSVGSQVRLS